LKLNLLPPSQPIPFAAMVLPIRWREWDPSAKKAALEDAWKGSEERKHVLRTMSEAEIKRRRYDK